MSRTFRLHLSVANLFSILFFLFAACPLDVAAQDETLEMLRKYPASAIRAREVELAKTQIDWQLKALTLQHQMLNDDLAQQQQTTESMATMLENLAQELPIEARFVDESSRSKIVSKALEEFLSAKLDLVVIQSQIETLEKTSGKVELTKRQQAEMESYRIAIETAKLGIEAAKGDLEHSISLAEKNLAPQNVVNADKQKYEIAKFKLRKAEADFAMVMNRPSDEKSGELSALRLQVIPIDARMKAAEKFLQKFVEANKGQSRMDALNREREQILRRVNRTEDRMFDLELEMMELKTLKQMVAESVENAQPSDASSGSAPSKPEGKDVP